MSQKNEEGSQELINPIKKKGKKHIKNIKNALPFIDSMVTQYYALTEAELSKFYGWKIHKLSRIVNICIPEGEEISKESINASAAISAISELNKMQGHYSPDKSINTNLNVDSDLEKVLELVRQNRKEY